MTHTPHATIAAIGLVFIARCELLNPSDGTLQRGTWGGDNAGLIVTDTSAHLHIGCTFGDVTGVIPIDAGGHFNVAETHNISAFPVDRGVYLPARLVGHENFPTVTFTVVVDDTVHHQTVTLGPVKVVFGKEPKMGPCPICRTPADQMRRLSARGTANPATAQPAFPRPF